MTAAASLAATGAAPAPARFVLVHGAFQDGTCWDRVASRLRAGGATVHAPSLPGHAPGENAAPGRVTLADYVGRVVEVVGTQPEPVVLVGHSLGGVTVSEVAERVPDRIRSVVFLSAYMPLDGESALALAGTDADSKLGPAIHIDQERCVAIIDDAAMREAFLNDCTGDALDAGLRSRRNQPAQPFGAPVRLTADRYGRVRKAYVATLDDQAVTHPLQRRMMARVPLAEVHALKADHASYLSADAMLAGVLAGVAARA